MTRKRVGLRSLLLACAALLPASVHAQRVQTAHTQAPHAQAARVPTAADSACTYSRCALRVDYGFLSTRLVRGATDERVSRLGWFGSGVDVLLAGPDSAAFHARQYKSRSQISGALGIMAASLAFVGTLQGDDGAPLVLTGIALELVALPYWLGSRRSLDRAVWWYNRELPRP